jgi:hypothetical protein
VFSRREKFEFASEISLPYVFKPLKPRGLIDTYKTIPGRQDPRVLTAGNFKMSESREGFSLAEYDLSARFCISERKPFPPVFKPLKSKGHAVTYKTVPDRRIRCDFPSGFSRILCGKRFPSGQIIFILGLYR